MGILASSSVYLLARFEYAVHNGVLVSMECVGRSNRRINLASTMGLGLGYLVPE